MKKEVNNDNYKYGLYFNFRAFETFFNDNGITTKTTVKEVYILQFIINIFMRGKNIPFVIERNERYILVTDSFLIGQLKYLNLKRRQIKNIIKTLECKKTIKRTIVGNNLRYVNVNSDLIQLHMGDDWTINAISYLNTYKPTILANVKNEFEHYFKDFKGLLDDFNNIRQEKDLPNDCMDIGRHLINYLKGKLNNPKYRK